MVLRTHNRWEIAFNTGSQRMAIFERLFSDYYEKITSKTRKDCCNSTFSATEPKNVGYRLKIYYTSLSLSLNRQITPLSKTWLHFRLPPLLSASLHSGTKWNLNTFSCWYKKQFWNLSQTFLILSRNLSKPFQEL